MMSDELDMSRFDPVKERVSVTEWQKFKIGDFVSCYNCEKGRTYMPGIGVIEAIYPDDEYPFVCNHNDMLYTYKASEISLHDDF